jgi:prophage regulatory protein
MKIELSTLEIQALSAAIVAEAMKTLAPRLEALESALLQRALPLSATYVQARQEVSSVKPAKPRRDMLRRGDLQEITGLSPSTIARLENKGQFPARVQLSTKRVAWPLAEVERWVEQRQLA